MVKGDYGWPRLVKRSRRTRVVKARYVLSRIDKDGQGKAMYTLSIML